MPYLLAIAILAVLGVAFFLVIDWLEDRFTK
jgi:hypothetical protein